MLHYALVQPHDLGLWFSGPETHLTLGRVPKDRAILWAESDSWPVRSSEPRRCTRQGRTTDNERTVREGGLHMVSHMTQFEMKESRSTLETHTFPQVYEKTLWWI